MVKDDYRICVIGLGYVGLPLAVEFGKKFNTIGFDINQIRVEELNNGFDKTLEVESDVFTESKKLSFTCNLSEIKTCNIYIVTVPTPINDHNQPDLSPLVSASEMVGKVLNKGDIVIYESTVYPGATEEECVPVLEACSRMRFNLDFFCGYSPERINPGDKIHRVTDIVKVTSGSNEDTSQLVDDLYKEIISAGTFKASSIKVAEAAKVIENTQRDVNIGLINELAIIFNRLDIDTEEVLVAAGTKWNFLPFRPGLVGGHCIGVDPYYLTFKAQSVGYHPELILAGRRINDGMSSYVVTQLVKAMLRKRIHVHGSKVLVMGLTFKEDCPDIRNTKVVDLIHELSSFGVNVDCYDPWVDSVDAVDEYSITLIQEPSNQLYDAVVLAVSHDKFRVMGIDAIRELCRPVHVIYDLKHILSLGDSDLRL